MKYFRPKNFLKFDNTIGMSSLRQ